MEHKGPDPFYIGITYKRHLKGNEVIVPDRLQALINYLKDPDNVILLPILRAPTFGETHFKFKMQLETSYTIGHLRFLLGAFSDFEKISGTRRDLFALVNNTLQTKVYSERLYQITK